MKIKTMLLALVTAALLTGCTPKTTEPPASSAPSQLAESSEPAASAESTTSVPSTAPTSSAPTASKPPSQAASTAPAGTTPTANTPAWNLTLVNRDHPIPDGYVPKLAAVQGYQFDSRASDSLSAMLADCRAAGLSPIICSAYRTNEKQSSLFNAEVQKQIANGYQGEEAKTVAATTVARPGTSEHQLGLAADIVATNYQILNKAQEDTAEYQWLAANCAKYGFIVRYPNGKSDRTFVIYEPWHFRYVGVEAASDIMSRGICLEEYLNEKGFY